MRYISRRDPRDSSRLVEDNFGGGGVLAAGETETGLQININGLSDTIYTARVSQIEFVLPFFLLRRMSSQPQTGGNSFRDGVAAPVW